MKRVFSILLLVMAIGGFLGVAIEENPGYVQIRYESFLLETSFWFFLLMLACSMFFVFSLSFAVRKIVMIRNHVAAKRLRKAERIFLQRRDVAICAMIECRWEEANNLFTELANESKAPLIFCFLLQSALTILACLMIAIVCWKGLSLCLKRAKERFPI